MAVKEFFKETFNIGGDGGKGEASLVADGAQLKLNFSAGFPIVKILTPVKDAVKKLVPGDKYDKYVDDAFEAALKALGVDLPAEPVAPAADAAPAVQG